MYLGYNYGREHIPVKSLPPLYSNPTHYSHVYGASERPAYLTPDGATYIPPPRIPYSSDNYSLVEPSYREYR